MGSFLNRKAHCTVNFPFAFHTVPTGSNYCVVEPSTLHFLLLWVPSANKFGEFVELVGERLNHLLQGWHWHVNTGRYFAGVVPCILVLGDFPGWFKLARTSLSFRCKSKSFLDAICRAQRIHAGGVEDPTLRKAQLTRADAQLTHAYIPAQPHAKSTINIYKLYIITDHQSFSLSLSLSLTLWKTIERLQDRQAAMSEKLCVVQQ